ncbi:MAG: hypothetical protein H7225_11555 [Massilia sp.]|nr:hypothetical protein [Aquabacterium sp.]
MNRVDEIGMTMRTIGQLGLMFRWVIDDVRNQVLSVQTATNEIPQGNNDLSSRTEQAAASVEETASSMEQMTVTVKNRSKAPQRPKASSSRWPAWPMPWACFAEKTVAVQYLKQLTRLFCPRPACSAEMQRAQSLIKAIDDGGLPLNPVKVNDIARQLGLEVSSKAPMDQTIRRIREALARM